LDRRNVGPFHFWKLK